MTRTLLDRAGNIAAFVVVVAVNILSNALPINGQSMPEISAKYPSPFTPAGFTFSIWGVIYLLLLLFVVHQALPAQRDSITLARIGPWFRLNCLANAAWLIAWHYDQLAASLAIMCVLLATLVIIYRILIAEIESASPAQHIVLYLPFSVYTAWIAVATVANLSILQTHLGLDDLGLAAAAWTQLKLAILAAVGATMVITRRDLPFVLVVAWAAFGIATKQAETPAVSGAATTVAILALALALRDGLLRLSGR